MAEIWNGYDEWLDSITEGWLDYQSEHVPTSLEDVAAGLSDFEQTIIEEAGK